MINSSYTPAIRFKGFADVWEQRKLRDEAIEMLAGGDIDKSKIVENGKYPIYANALTNDGIVGYYDDYYRVKAPAVTVTGRGDVGHAQARTVDFTPVVRLLTIRSEHDAYFLENAINNHSVIVESTGVPQLTVPQLENYMIQFPKTIEEETKIGEYFRNLDNLITLHQRKLQKLSNIKKSMLEKMFPKNGSNVPEIRFNGFTEAWEQRKLGEVGTTYTGLSGRTKEDFGHGNGQFVTYMNVFSNPVGLPDMTEAVEIDDSQNKVLFGDVLFTTSSETPEEVGMSSVWLENAENTYLNSFCFGYRPTVEFNPYYLAYMLRSSSMRKKITFLAQGISRYNISKNKMLDIEIPIPKIEEQKQIGSYFRNLDNLITLHQCKLEKLQNIKKAFLEKMFV